MVSSNTNLNNFVGGLVSPKVFGRDDLGFFTSSFEKLQNFIPLPQGPLSSRPGTKHVHHTRRNNVAIIEPFIFSDDQSYILEFTDLYMRVHQNDFPITEAAQNITDVTNANPAVVEIVGHGYSNGDEIYITGVVGVSNINSRFFIVNNVTPDTFELQDIDENDFDSTALGAYISGGTASKIIEFSTVWTEADLPNLDFSQNADVVIGVDGAHRIQSITRLSNTNWSIAVYATIGITFNAAGEYPRSVTFYEARLWFGGTANNPETFYGSKLPQNDGTPRYDDFTIGVNPDDALTRTLAPSADGRVDTIRWLLGNVKYLTIGTLGGITKVDGGGADFGITPTQAVARPIDSLGCANIKPIIGEEGEVIYIQRGKLTVRTIEYSFEKDRYTSNDRNLLSDELSISEIDLNNGFEGLTFQSSRPNILWAYKANGDICGITFNSKEEISGWHPHKLGGTNSKVISNATVPRITGGDRLYMVVERTINGVTRRHIEYMSDFVFGISRDSVYTDENSEQSDKLKYENIFYERMKDAVHLDDSLSFDGSLRAVNANATLTPQSVSGNGVVFTASSSIFKSEDVGNIILKKYIDGTESGYATIVQFNSDTEVLCDIEVDFDSVDVINAGDWYITASVIGGLYHLEGETVNVVVDGGNHPDRVVQNGEITLNLEATKCHVGKKYRCIAKTTEVSSPLNLNGNPINRLKNINHAIIYFRNTLGCKFGTNLYSSLKEITFSTTDSVLGRPPILFTGPRKININDSWSRSKNIYIIQDNPLPCIIDRIDYYMETSM